MRVLLLFRGASGCGKSAFIKEHGLEQYTLSSDEIRLNFQSPILNPDGTLGISQKANSQVWKMLFNLLEKRMSKGEFTVVDATNAKTSDISRYKEMADRYRYRIYLIDMTDIPIETVKARNASRLPEYKRVPDYVIDNMYVSFATQNIPKGIKVIKPEEFDTILYKPTDFSQYEKIHHIGDIHGCNTVLQRYLDGDLKDNELYIFCGDYLDRGIENAEVLEFLLSIYEKPNVILLEGNHEVYLRNLSSNIEDYTKTFKLETLPEINKAIRSKKFTKRDLRKLCRSFGQVCYYTYHGKKVLVCHGGISNMKENLIFVSTDQIIRGVGNYEDYMDCAMAFERNTNSNTYQISGHRNMHWHAIQATDRCFNLEGKVEFGWYLRTVTLDKNGFKTYNVKNNVFRIQDTKEDIEENKELTHDDFIESLRKSNLIKEKVMGNISSFNFTRGAFYKKAWNKQTIKARGLFIDNRDNSIVLRGYDKFKNINESDETKIDSLQSTLKFPVTAYVKENGFLGLISYNKDDDRLIFATKSIVDYASNESDLVNVFKDLYYEITTESDRMMMLNFLRDQYNADCGLTVICECVHQEKDPHIIEYSKNNIYLLDIISNTLDGIKLAYEDLVEMAETFGLTCKEKAITLNNWKEFYEWYVKVTDEYYLYQGRYIEGFVIEDADGFMVKIKLAYYNLWKVLRGITHSVLKFTHISEPLSINNKEVKKFYHWLKMNRNKYVHVDENNKVIVNKDVNIIQLRNEFKKGK